VKALTARLLGHHAKERAQLAAQLEAALRAKEAAEIANLAKARYLANVSHEIRSPLNAIYGYAQLVEQEADVRPVDAARVIRRCCEHMTSLVESLLDISRLENGLLRVRSEIVRLPDFLEQIVWMMRPAAEAKGLAFIHEAPARLPDFVRTDQSRLRQALINLIGNAIKFTDEGSVSFRIAYRGQVATLEIEDTGPGISAEDQQRIFDPYEQVAGPGEHARTGVGLGLPITKAIVEILGGKLELESEPGRGSCFRVMLMLSEPAHALAPEAPRRRIIGHEGLQRSILVVDDDPDQRDFLERFLIACGFEVVALPNGEAAVTLCGSRGFDLIVLDISLPGISGWETAARIREKLGQDVLIVMASANAQEFHRPEYHRPAHDHFFVKPYRLDEMAEAIAALLRLSWKWEATAGASEGAEPARGRLPPAAWPHVERLRERIQIGHVRGIEAEIAMLADAAPDHGRLVSALYAALDEFDLAGMAKLLEQT
jgi:nitrogen-specific signal transduction histidine kinase/ActR/RegA family two-component response regulator